MDSIQAERYDQIPIGKSASDVSDDSITLYPNLIAVIPNLKKILNCQFRGSEEEEEEEEEEEGEGEEEEESDTHEEEEEELDEIDMEVSYTHQQQRGASPGPSPDAQANPVSIRMVNARALHYT